MFQIAYRPIAVEEYETAIAWYAERSKLAAERFVAAVNDKLDSVSRNPKQYKRIYKHYHEVSIRKYPYSIVYIIEESLQKVVIVAIYHQKRHPKKKYRK
jgi:plasmid stabilization system protein ParE